MRLVMNPFGLYQRVGEDGQPVGSMGHLEVDEQDNVTFVEDPVIQAAADEAQAAAMEQPAG